MFVDQYPIPNNSSVSDLIQIADPSPAAASHTYSSNSACESDSLQKLSPLAFDASSRTLKSSSYNSKQQRKIRALAHTLCHRAAKAQCLPFVFTLTVPGSTLEAAFAIDQHAVSLIRALMAKIRANWLDGGTFDWLCVVERVGPNPLHFQGLLALPKSSWNFATDESLTKLWTRCLTELSGSTGVNLFEANDGVIWKTARCQIEPVESPEKWAHYLSKSDTKSHLALPDGSISVPVRWYDANKALRSACIKGNFECHFETTSVSAGLMIIDELLVPTVEKITGPLNWREHFNREWKRRIGSFTSVPPASIPDVVKALKRFQRQALHTQQSLLHCPDLLISLDAGGALMLRLRQKRLA